MGFAVQHVRGQDAEGLDRSEGALVQRGGGECGERGLAPGDEVDRAVRGQDVSDGEQVLDPLADQGPAQPQSAARGLVLGPDLARVPTAFAEVA